MGSSYIEIDSEVLAAAESVGEVAKRSASEQLLHWAQIGRAVEDGFPSLQRLIDQFDAGAIAYDDLSGIEQLVIRVHWEERMAKRLASLNFDEMFQKLGRTYVDLDENGNVQVHGAPPGESR